MIEKKIPEPKMETCAFCGEKFDIRKRNNSGFLHGKPICAPCREDQGDYL